MLVRLNQGKSISLASLAKDPQNWICLMAAVTLLGLCTGVFDISEENTRPTAAQAAEINVLHPQLAQAEAGERL